MAFLEITQMIQSTQEVLKRTLSPRDPGSLYGRGLARLRFGDADGGRADLAAAKALDPDVTAEFARYGLGE